MKLLGDKILVSYHSKSFWQAIWALDFYILSYKGGEILVEYLIIYKSYHTRLQGGLGHFVAYLAVPHTTSASTVGRASMALRREESSLPLDRNCKRLSETSPVNDDILRESATSLINWKTFRKLLAVNRTRAS